MKRVFIAIKVNPSGALLELIENLQLKLRDERIRWLDPGNIHLTLAFIGERDNNEIRRIINYTSDACHGRNKFMLDFQELGVFRSTKTPRVLWLGVKDSKELNELAEDVRSSLRRPELYNEDKAFKPHLTLGRMKRIENRYLLTGLIEYYRNTPIQKQLVDKIILYESILGAGGAAYHVLHEFPFLFGAGDIS